MSRFAQYEGAITPAREAFAHGRSLAAVASDGVEVEVLELFLIHFSAFGVAMTEPVESWITRAGVRAEAIGLVELGRALQMHAKHEAGHHLMMIEDTKKLVARWNQRRGDSLDAEALLAQPIGPGPRRYRELHERVIAGDAPYAQLAIEYEIERLSVAHGAQLIGNCMKVLGREVLAGLSFLEEHVAVDAGHTRFNAAELERLLEAHPDFLPALSSAGAEALSAYEGFLDDCLAAALRLRPRPR
jgi:hypothetical protein